VPQDRLHSELLNPSDDVDSDDWRAARALASDLKAVLGDRELTDESAKELASRWGISVRTVWRRVRAYRREGSLRAFLRRPRGPAPGVGRLDTAVESLVASTARTWWKATENSTIAER
jgi:DNA-binding Lrp family transcriptional regulator